MKDERRYFRFVRHYEGDRVVVKIGGDSDLNKLIEEFESFLRGCGYELDGTLDIVPTVET